MKPWYIVPDYETWWYCYRNKCRYLECDPATMRVVKFWKSNNKSHLTKAREADIIVSVDKYFLECLHRR